MMDFSGYDSQSGRRNRGGGRGRLLLAVVVGAVAVVLLLTKPWASSSQGTPQSPAPTATAAAAAQPGIARADQQLSEGACVDPTTSTATSFAAGVRSDLAAAVASLAPAAQQPMSQSAPAVSLWIRQVDTTSLSSLPTPYTKTVNIPGVRGLAASEPSPGASDYVNAESAYSTDYNAANETRTAARTAAAKGAQAIASLPLDDNPQSRSAISACVSGLLVTVPQVGVRSYLIASDLEENKAPQLTGSFARAPLVVIQACDSGNASFCQGNLNNFLAEMKRLQVGSVTLVRPEDAAQAISEWVHGQPVQGQEVTP